MASEQSSPPGAQEPPEASPMGLTGVRTPNFPLSSDVPKREELPDAPATAGSGAACPPLRWPPRCCAPCSPACCRWPAGACCRRSAAWGAGCAPGRAARPCSPACSASSTCARRRTTEAGRPRAGTGRDGPGRARRLLPPREEGPGRGGDAPRRGRRARPGSRGRTAARASPLRPWLLGRPPPRCAPPRGRPAAERPCPPRARSRRCPGHLHHPLSRAVGAPHGRFTLRCPGRDPQCPQRAAGRARMSGSTARKVQPFTISTRLSLPKCAADFPGDACPGIALASALDSHRGLRRSINERISLYLAHARAGPAAAAGQPRSPSPGEDGGPDEDRLNRSSLARSIKKITLSNWYGDAGTAEAGGHGDPARAGGERNHNNNNSRTGKAQFKVFLRKDVDVEDKQQEPGSVQASVFCSPVDRCSPLYMLAASPVSSPQKESPKGKESAAAPRCSGRSGVGAAPLLDLSPLIAQFNREMLQAESWVRGKLRDLKDGCELQDWEEVAQTLQRDMKDFENTLIKLNQMGEQLMWRAGPSAEAVRRQLLALQEQWQLLKQTAASQSKALGGLRSLQDFNRKAERLEAWIKHKEEKPSLAALLQECPDKIQLTRRILDLKQEEQQFQSLHKELNSLAQKLEKQGKNESRNVSARRKHLNKAWLRLQGTLKEHHEALQLALEVASFLQQADILLGVIHAKQSSICSTGKPGEGEPCQDQDVRDIASQVMMLDVTVSQLLNLQPSLAARVTSKHRDVKESWAQLQQALRTGKAPAWAGSSPGGRAAAPNVELRGDDSSHGAVGKEAAAKWTRGLGSMVPKDVLEKMAENKKGEESNPGSPAVGQSPHQGDNKRRKEAEAEWGMQQLETQVQDVCQVVNTTLSPYKESVAMGVPPRPVEAAQMQQELSARAVLLEGSARGRPPGSPQVEAMLRELGELWEDLQRRHQENGVVLQEIDKALRLVGELDQAERWLQDVAGSLLEPAAMRSPAELRQDLEEMSRLEKQLLLCGLKLQALREEAAGEAPTEHEGARKMQRKVEMVEEKLAHVQAALRHRAADLRDSLVLSEFLQDLQEEEAQSQQGSAAPGSGLCGSQGCFPPLSAQAEKSPIMSRPLGELQEAVEMLNDAAKERERVMEVAAETESLERLVAKISPQLEALQCRAKALSEDIALAEKSFTTVKSEKDLQGLQGLLSCQQEMEHAVSQTLQGQLEELERVAARLQELCPARQCPISQELQETLWAWAGLQELLRETRLRVQQASQLRHFFKDYLAMISWTEDTRAQIFSESPSSSSIPETPCEELERRIEEKLKEFEALAAAGQQLVSEEHYLSATIKERLEELQSMLGWVLVRWRAQRHQQQDLGSRQEDRREPENLSRTSPTRSSEYPAMLRLPGRMTSLEAEGSRGTGWSEWCRRWGGMHANTPGGLWGSGMAKGRLS
ncbi:spectrin beta chain, non-erythrocytic 5-like [Molothrus ater]|uniref:spectrin beta chain, non-erythrocytic 5-like n=1 Tax=Molothrus ater TaxID=84834 RepID=UPI0023E84E0F|nr:spectrin beta chain, non-erythrocytic 5-like [Molothrus ater]